ncbi:MAG: metal ABC transporter ATP-binding protein [Rhabdochlamydiaceae bacterium]|nr:metal ABC transporter ATP-binding protein [Candidatus Amphrikana amoebophyrae]
MKNSLQVKDLTVNYGNYPALWDINFSLTSGQLVAIVGPNGAGKSTLIKAILQFVQPLSSEVTFFDGMSLKEARKKIAYVPQTQSIDWEFPITAIEVVIMGDYHQSSFLKWPKASSRKKALNLLKELGLESLANRHISELSGGQKQKLFVARALMQSADLYFFDEPFAGIDHTTEKQILEIFKKLAKEGKTLLVVHHDLSTVESNFDHLILLNTQLVACGPCKEVFNFENLRKAYGHSDSILGKLLGVKKEKKSGLA